MKDGLGKGIFWSQAIFQKLDLKNDGTNKNLKIITKNYAAEQEIRFPKIGFLF